MTIEEKVKGKSVLMVPVYSTRSYESGVYNLLADGNISKFLMKILNAEAKEIDILYPENSIGIEEIRKITDKYAKCKTEWSSHFYGVNAHETRNVGKVFYDSILLQPKQYDIIISEIDTLAELAIYSDNKKCNKDNFIYWAGSWTADGARWDNEEHCNLNRKIAKEITTACLLKGQVDLYGGKTFFDECIYEPKYFEKQTIFFPFRLSDKSYHAEEFRQIIKEIKADGFDNFIVLYTDVNDSHVFDDENSDVFIKVPCNKFVYQAILKGKPIIPYLDNVDKNYHSNIYEFLYYGCDVIMVKNDMFVQTTQIQNMQELKDRLKEKLGG